MIDVKKLITGFLILATAAVCSGLIFSLVNITSGTTMATNTAQQATIGGNAGGAAANSMNAFLPTEAQVQQVAAALAPELASSTMIVTSTDPDNLTNVLATNFVNGVVAANPNGPTGTDANGDPVLASPDVNALAASIADSTTTQNLQIPDWDVEAASIPVTVVATTSAAALTSYGTAITGMLSDHLNAQVQNIVSDQTGSADASDITYIASQLQGALQDTASLKVPAPAEAYQKSLLTYLVYQKNMTQLYALAQTDPVKAALIFQQEDQRFSSVQQNFLNQAQNLTSNVLSLQKVPAAQHENILLSFVDNTFGISEAHALWPVFDPATWAAIGTEDWTQIGTQLQNMLKNTLLQILKNTLMAIVQREVLTWVQGSGAPRFITNWGTQLINAAQASAINSINAQMSCGVYPAFVPQIKVTLNAFYLPGNNKCANQFAAALGSNSFQQFYNNFANGGFVAFGASTLPSGNPYGQLFFNAQSVGVSYSNQQAATKVQTQTSGGFKGNQVCDDGSNPNGTHNLCQQPPGSTAADYLTSSPCKPGETTVVLDANGVCGDGTNPVVTTPAAVTGFALNTASQGTTQQIAAANDIIGVLNSVLSSLLLSLANTAVNAAGQLVNQGLTSLNAASITAGATTAAPAQIPLACNPSTQTIPSPLAGGGPVSTSTPTPTSTSPASLSATGGTVDVNGNPPTYSWTDTNGASGTGTFFSDTFTSPGTYTVTLTDSTGDASTTCTVIQQ